MEQECVCPRPAVRENRTGRQRSGKIYLVRNAAFTELLAIINALKFADENKKKMQRVIIYSDSAYAINGLNNWIHGWRANGWRNSKKEEVANLDLWLILNPYVDLIDYSFQKVKGHADNIWNNKVDEMVQNQTLDAKMNWRGKENAE